MSSATPDLPDRARPGPAAAAHPQHFGVAGLVVVGVVVARVGVVGHAPDAAGAVFAVVCGALFFFFGSSRVVDVVAAALLGAALCAVPLSRDPWVSFLALSLVVGVVAGVAVGAAAPRRAVLTGLAIAGTLHGLVTLWQRFVSWPAALADGALPPEVLARMSSLRPLGLSLSPDLGAAVALAGVVAAVALAVDLGAKGRVGAIVGAIVCAGAVAVSRSYGVFVCAGVGVVVFAIRQRSWKALSLLIVAGVGVVAVAATRGVAALSTSAEERWRNWQIAVDAFIDAPVVGQGLLRFAPAYLERRTPDANVTRYAHSFVLQWLSETGVVGGAALVVAVVAVVAAVVNGPRTLSHNVVVAGAAALCARGLIDYDLHVSQTALLCALLVGLAVRAEHKVSGRHNAVAGVVVVVGVVVGGAFVVRAVVPGVVKGVDVEAAFAAVAAGDDVEASLGGFVDDVAPAAVAVARARADKGDVDGAVVLVDKALRSDPGSAAAWVMKVQLTEVKAGDVEAVVREAGRWGVRFKSVE